MFTALYVIEVIGRPRRSRIQAKTVEKSGAEKSSFIALTARFHIYLMSGVGRPLLAIFLDVFHRMRETAYISHTRVCGRPS
jgi:DNA-binding GntR family transcriptional regulator